MKKFFLEADENQQGNAVVEWCDLKKIPIVKIQNEGIRNYLLDKKRGIRKGFPDFFIPLVHPPYTGLFIELKKNKGSKVSKSQREWLFTLNSSSYLGVIAYGQDHMISIISMYMSLKIIDFSGR